MAIPVTCLVERQILIERLLNPGSIPERAMPCCVLGKDNFCFD